MLDFLKYLKSNKHCKITFFKFENFYDTSMAGMYLKILVT